MSRDLPQDTEKALEAIAAGWGREPGFAHPDCVCIAEDKRQRESRPQWEIADDLSEMTWTGSSRFERQPCPVHPKGRR